MFFFYSVDSDEQSFSSVGFKVFLFAQLIFLFFLSLIGSNQIRSVCFIARLLIEFRRIKNRLIFCFSFSVGKKSRLNVKIKLIFFAQSMEARIMTTSRNYNWSIMRMHSVFFVVLSPVCSTFERKKRISVISGHGKHRRTDVFLLKPCWKEW